MSRNPKIKHLTTEELKSRLFTHFQRNGSFDHLRSELRGRLITELFKVAEPVNTNAFPSTSDVNKCILPIQVCNWLVYDHLSKQGYEYTLSTFVTEASLPYPDKILTAGDVLGLLGLHNSSNDFQRIITLYSQKNELDCLHSLLLSIIKVLFDIPTLDSKPLETGDQSNNNKNPAAHSQILLDNSQLNDESIDPETKSFIFKKQNISMEQSFYDQLQITKEENEKEVQTLRQKLLKELEKLYAQERGRHLEMEQAKNNLKKEHDSLLKEREMLKEKELLLEKEYEHNFELKFHDMELQFVSKLHSKDKELEDLKKQMYESEKKLIKTEYELSVQKDNCSLTKRELDELKHMYKILQDKYGFVLDENKNIIRKFESMSDYSILKEELSAKSREVLHLKSEVKIHQETFEKEKRKFLETVRSLENQLSLKEPQLLQTQTELDDIRNTFQTEKNIWLREKKRLEQEIKENKMLYSSVLQRLEEQDGNIQDLHKTTNVLYYNYSKQRTENSFVTKSMHNNPSTSLKFKPVNLFTKGSIYLENKQKSEPSFDFMLEAKSRFNKLVQEENDVQKKYFFVSNELPIESGFVDINKILSTPVTNFNSLQHSKISKNNMSLPYLASKQALYPNFEKSDNFKARNNAIFSMNHTEVFASSEGFNSNPPKSFVPSFNTQNIEEWQTSSEPPICNKSELHQKPPEVELENKQSSSPFQHTSISGGDGDTAFIPKTQQFKDAYIDSSFLIATNAEQLEGTPKEEFTVKQNSNVLKHISASDGDIVFTSKPQLKSAYLGSEVKNLFNSSEQENIVVNLKTTSSITNKTNSLTISNSDTTLQQKETDSDAQLVNSNKLVVQERGEAVIEELNEDCSIKNLKLEKEVDNFKNSCQNKGSDLEAVLENQSKEGNCDSASELSEVHFSCGSDHGKDDSDAW